MRTTNHVLTEQEYVVWILELWDCSQKEKSIVPFQRSVNWRQTPECLIFFGTFCWEEKPRTQTMNQLHFDG